MSLLTDDIGLCLHVLHEHNTSKSYPQFLLPDVLVERHFPHFCAALDTAAMRQPIAR